MEYPFRVFGQHERDFAGFRNYPYVAVLNASRIPAGEAQQGTWWRLDVRTSSLGAFAACLYGHVQATSVHESVLDEAAALRRYRVLYLAD